MCWSLFLVFFSEISEIFNPIEDVGHGGWGGGGSGVAKKPPTSFSPITSTKELTPKLF